ncbi:hypothetical protein [Streptomyces sp. CNQ-509]|nr:hypothetical protein [Streptomyces sp. CNQ-509]
MFHQICRRPAKLGEGGRRFFERAARPGQAGAAEVEQVRPEL